jgi:probable rRNA maturation factor
MNVLRFLNRQKICVLDRQLLRTIARTLLEELLGRENYELGVHFVGAHEMAGINETFLGHEGSTDVITFDYTSLHGEIFICVDDALVHARRFRVSWQAEIVRYLVHGSLHLEGCDDAEPRLRRAMKRRENKLLKELSRRFDFGKLGRLIKDSGPHERK